MNPILVVGAETVVGANLSIHLADQYDVFAASLAGRLELAGCRVLPETGSQLSPERTIAEVCPQTVVLCGPAARSSWDAASMKSLRAESLDGMRAWAAAAAKAGAKVVLISSDAVFTGPWMFHDEEGESHCATPAATAIRALEEDVADLSENTLIVRTNAYGWSPSEAGGWLENILALIEARRPIQLDPVRHATPILATDLADILEKMLVENLTGTYHVAGAERISPMGFAQRLAGQFNLPWIPARKSSIQTEAPIGFGAGECSLQTRKLRLDLCIPMPLLSESLGRLEGQQINGHREKLAPNATVQLRAA
ncbi:MAG TPA: sugar nucleotide-binding protein [Caulifigura sp.]|nr:sugar nucleotide-binding protein [Caulifigura sp.]